MRTREARAQSTQFPKLIRRTWAISSTSCERSIAACYRAANRWPPSGKEPLPPAIKRGQRTGLVAPFMESAPAIVNKPRRIANKQRRR